ASIAPRRSPSETTASMATPQPRRISHQDLASAPRAGGRGQCRSSSRALTVASVLRRNYLGFFAQVPAEAPAAAAAEAALPARWVRLVVAVAPNLAVAATARMHSRGARKPSWWTRR